MTHTATNGANGTQPASSKKKFQLSHAHIVHLMRVLEKAGTRDGEVYTYNNTDESDERVAADTQIEGLTGEKVREFRREYFGRLASEIRKPALGKGEQIADLITRVELLEEAVRKLEARATK